MVAGMAVSLALAASAHAIAGPLEIRHDAVGCVAVDRYSQIVAGATLAESVARAELQFRIRPDADWYGVPMTADGATWSALLPRPVAPLTQFEYRIVMTATDLRIAETVAFQVRVAEAEATCTDGPPSSVAVTAPIVVRVPAGAPVMPPVPPGFSPAGVVAAAGPKPQDKWSIVKWIAGAGAAAGIGAVATGVGSEPKELPDVSDFRVLGTAPSPGSEISVSRDHMSVFVEVSGDPREPLTFTWSVGLHPRDTFGGPCVTMYDTATIGAARPVTVELSGMVRWQGLCSASFQSVTAKLRIVVDGQIVREVTQELPFRIVP